MVATWCASTLQAWHRLFSPGGAQGAARDGSGQDHNDANGQRAWRGQLWETSFAASSFTLMATARTGRPACSEKGQGGAGG